MGRTGYLSFDIHVRAGTLRVHFTTRSVGGLLGGG